MARRPPQPLSCAIGVRQWDAARCHGTATANTASAPLSHRVATAPANRMWTKLRHREEGGRKRPAGGRPSLPSPCRPGLGALPLVRRAVLRVKHSTAQHGSSCLRGAVQSLWVRPRGQDQAALSARPPCRGRCSGRSRRAEGAALRMRSARAGSGECCAAIRCNGAGRCPELSERCAGLCRPAPGSLPTSCAAPGSTGRRR